MNTYKDLLTNSQSVSQPVNKQILQSHLQIVLVLFLHIKT
jgi:hypothetical protein